MSFLSDQRNFFPRTGSGVPPQLIEAASPHLRTSPGLEVAKEAKPEKVEVAQAEVAEIMVNMTKEPTAELAVIRGGGLRLSAVTAPLKTFLSSSPIPTSFQSSFSQLTTFKSTPIQCLRVGPELKTLSVSVPSQERPSRAELDERRTDPAIDKTTTVVSTQVRGKEHGRHYILNL